MTTLNGKTIITTKNVLFLIARLFFRLSLNGYVIVLYLAIIPILYAYRNHPEVAPAFMFLIIFYSLVGILIIYLASKNWKEYVERNYDLRGRGWVLARITHIYSPGCWYHKMKNEIIVVKEYATGNYITRNDKFISGKDIIVLSNYNK